MEDTMEMGLGYESEHEFFTFQSGTDNQFAL